MVGETEEGGARGVPVVEGQSRNSRAVVSCDCGVGHEIGCMAADSGNTAVGAGHTAAG